MKVTLYFHHLGRDYYMEADRQLVEACGVRQGSFESIETVANDKLSTFIMNNSDEWVEIPIKKVQIYWR